MGRTNYSLNEMLNSVTKRAFNRYTSQTVDYQNLEAATTTTGLVSNRREYSSASILANTFSLNAKNIVESNYDPFLKTFVSNLISRKTFPITGSHTITCTDDRRFLAVTSEFSNTDPNEVRVYEFDENSVEQFELNSSGVIDTSGNTETFDVDINDDGSETFVAKKVGTDQFVVDNFDQEFNSVSSTTLMTTIFTLLNGLISVSESGSRVAVSATSNNSFYSRVLGLQVHDNLKTNEYYSLYDINADIYTVRSVSTYFTLMSRNGRIVVVNIGGTVITFEIPVASPSGVVSLSPVHTHTMGIDKFDLSYDGKVMLTHSSSDALIYIWNGLEWKQFGQNIPTGLTQVNSSAISYYADYFVVVSSTAMKIFKLDKTSKIFEQYGNTITGDFGTTGQTVRINKLGDTVVTGNSQINSSSGQSLIYMHDGERWGIIEEVSGSTAGDNLGKFLKLSSNNGDKIFLGSTDEILVKSTTITSKSSGWKQRGSVITTTKVDDDFGSSLSLSNDGTYLAIGIPRERGTSLDDTVDGSVKVYRFAQGDWSQYGTEILGDGPIDFGKYVSISLDGSKVAVGSDKNTVVKVYDTSNTINVYNNTLTDTVSVTPLTSLLEMSGDGNRLFLNTDPIVSSTILQSLTVVSTPSGNKYSLDGVTQPTLYLKKGVTFTGIASTFREGSSHPLRISATPDGAHGGDSTVIAEVNSSGNLLIPTSEPNTLYYFCGQHPNMGGMVKIIQGLSVWDKNGAGVWEYRDGLTEGDVIQLSNNGNYLSVDYSNTSRLYGIGSDGVVSKIGDDITATTVSSPVNVFRTFTPTHINTGVSDSGSLILASYQDSSRAVEICSLTWDTALSNFYSLSTQSSEITGFSTLSQAKYGIVLSRNGQTLIVYDDSKFSVYTYDGTQWTFIRSTVIGNIRYVAISYDGTLMAYHFFHAVDGYLISFRNTISGFLVGFSLGFTVQVSTFAFKSNTTLAVCIPNQDIQLYNYVNNSWVSSNEITPGYSSPFTEAHAKWSGDGTRLAVGDANAERVSFYEYDNSLVSVTTFIQSSSTISGPTEQVVSGNGNVRVVGHPQYNLYTGYVEIYEKDGNGDWPSTANATFNGPSPTENFGSSIGISETGTRVVIGSGSKMIVVEKSGGTWSQLGSDISGSTTKVVISGDGTIVFNSHGTNLYSYELSSGSWVTNFPILTTDGSIVKVDSSSNGDDIALSKNNSNKVYRKSSTSIQLGADIDGEYEYDYSGWSVSLSADGSRVAIGARLNDGEGREWPNSGHVRVYDWSGSSWTKMGDDIDGEYEYDESGYSVSLSADGSRVAIGARTNDGNGSNSGHVRVYDWSGSRWTKVGADINGEAANDYSGNSVSLSADGSRVAIGAYQNDGNGYNSGHVRVYDWSGSSWTKVGADIDGEVSSDYSGWSVSLSADGSRVATGSYLNDGNGSNSGHVRVYDWSGSSWTKMGADIDGEAEYDYSGRSVSLSADGSRVAIGANFNDGNGSNSGHVRVYDWSGSSWTKVGADIDGEAFFDESGNSVSLSADGSRVAIGAYGNDGNGSSSGHVRVYDWSGSSWTKVGADIDGEAYSDYSGYSVSLSADGSRVATGAYLNDGNGSNSGHVRVFTVGASYSLQSTNSGPMIDISNDGNTTLTVNSGMGTFNLAALSGDATKAVVWDAVKLKQYHYTSGSWVKTYELDIDYTPTSLSINTDGSIVGVASSSDVRFYVFGPTQVANGWTLHSFITGGGNTLQNFGSVVDLSNDGNTVVVGAPGDGTSSYKGYVKVYDYVSSTWTLRHTITPSGTSDVNFGKAVSLSSNGNRVGYVFDQENTVTTPAISGSIVIGSNYSSGISTNNGGLWTNNSGFSLSYSNIRLTLSSIGGTNSGIWFPVTFGSQWSITFEWSLDNNSFYGDADDMRVVFYAPNQPSSYAGSQHGGYSVFHGFYGTESQRVRTPSDSNLVSRTVSYGSSTSYKTVTVSYNNGVLFTRVTGTSASVLYDGANYTFTGSDLTAQQALWGTQTYVAITGRTGGAAANQYIRNINISWIDPETTTTITSSQASIRDSVDGTLVNPLGSGEILNLSEGRELSTISMSSDGTQLGIRATSGSYDAVVKGVQPLPNGWTLSGDIMSFSFPTSPSFASNSKRDMSVSSDGNIIAFGWVLSQIRVRVYGFSNGTWSRLHLSGGYDIFPGDSGNPTAISVDLSSDGMTLATLSSYSDHVAEAKTYSYSSGGWVQIGSTINSVETGSNTIKISGDGTTLALGNNTPDSPYLFNVVRVYRKFQDWESIFGAITEGKTPTNFLGASLNLTNDGNNLVTYNTSGVGFYTSSTQAVPSQHLNDITVSGTTIDMGGIHFSDSGDRLFVMSGDERVRVYDTTHNQESQFGASINVRDFSITKDGSSLIVTSDVGLAQVFSRNETSWSQIGSNITANMSGGGVTTDIKSGGNSVVLLGSSDDLQLHKYENGTWSQVATSSGTRGTSVVITDTDDIVVGSGSVKTFGIKDEFQDISFTAPTLSLNGEKYVRLESGTSYTEDGVTVTTSATITPAVKISGDVTSDEPRVYTIKYEAEDLQRKKAEPIFRTVEVIPKVPIIKLEGPRIIYHLYGTKLDDPGVTASVPINIYWRDHNSTTVYSGFPNFQMWTPIITQITIYYTNDTPDEFLRTASSVERTVYLRRRPVLTLQGSSTVNNPLGQRYVDLGVNITQSGVTSPDVTVSFNEPNVNLSQTQTVTYTAKDQFGIEAIPITRQVIVRKRPTITTSGTLYRTLYDPISIPTPVVEPVSLLGSLQSSNNIYRNQNGNYSITYNVTDGDGISADTTRQSYQVGSYGKLELSKNGVISAFSRDGQSLAVFSTDVRLYKLGPDSSWSSNGSIATPIGSSVSSMKFSNDGRYIVIGMSLHLTIGLVSVYKENNLFDNNWEHLGLDLFGVDYLGKFGHKVEINDSGSRIFVGAPEANTNGGTLFKAGFVKVYEWNGVFWAEESIIEGQNPVELLGTSISISKDGNILAIGSPGFTRTTIVNSVVTSLNVGKTSVYRYVNGTWEDYLGSVIDNGTEGARNAFSLSLSSDGRTLAVGSESNGGVRVYAISALKWRPIGSHISGNFGKTVSISDDATVVIGSENEYYGRAYIYTLTNDWTKSGTTFDKVISAREEINDFGKRVNVDNSGRFICVDSATDVRIYEI